MNIENKQIALLNLLLASWLALSCLDEIKNTSAYRHGLKQRLNALEPELQKIINQDLDLLWGVDDKAMYNLMEGQKEFIGELATVRPEQIAGLAEVLKKFKQMPEYVLHILGVKIIESKAA